MVDRNWNPDSDNPVLLANEHALLQPMHINKLERLSSLNDFVKRKTLSEQHYDIEWGQGN